MIAIILIEYVCVSDEQFSVPAHHRAMGIALLVEREYR